MKNKELETYLNEFLDVKSIDDYAPNGLQVEGKQEINNIVFGVTASLELIEKARALNADAIVVHHGWFWKGEPRQITGMRYRRIHALISSQINLFAYHLPLDMHPVVGNNAVLAQALNAKLVEKVGPSGLVSICELNSAVTTEEFKEKLSLLLSRKPLVLGNPDKLIKRLGICTGAAQDFLSLAKASGCDAFISGEVSERTTYEAREEDITYFACGHHATERFGVQALMKHLSQVYPEVKLTYIEVNNPV